MTSAKFSHFLTLLSCLHFHATSLTKLPYSICFWGTSLPPPCADIISTCPLVCFTYFAAWHNLLYLS